MRASQVGLGIVGSGRIGRLRAVLARSNAQVKFLALADPDPAQVERLAKEVDADFYTTDTEELLTHPDVDAVLVSSPEHAHADPVCRALELGKPVLVEKPLGLSLADADRILEAQREYNGDLYVGYTQRLRRRFLNAKEQVLQGRLGKLVTARLASYAPEHMGAEIYRRSPTAGPVTDVLTYMVDMGLWYFEGRHVTRVYAQGTNRRFPDGPPGAGDGAWAIVTLDDGSTLNLGVTWLLPDNWPANVGTLAVDLMGTKGALMIDDSHRDTVLATKHPVASPYAPGVEHDVLFLQSMPAGDILLGDFWGPMRDETRLWLEHVTTGREIPLTRPEEARATLEVTLAIERSARLNQPVDLPLKSEVPR